jgi:3-oxoadipate enol-lactonase
MTGLLFVHAFPLDRRMWEPQLAAIPGAIAVDLPGFGEAPPPPGGAWTVALAARRCEAALEEAGWSRAVVCGLSMGGYVAFELWRRAPERLAGLVLANTRAEPDTPDARAARLALAERLDREGNVLAAEPPPLLSSAAPPELRERVRRLVADQSPAAIAAALRGMAERPDSRPDLPRIAVPTLVIASDRDELIPAETTARIAERVPGAELAVIQGAGHLSNLERPEAFTELLLAFVARLGIDPGSLR